jgi:hypothetical protein
MDYEITRFVFQRLMAVIYLVAFLVALNQFAPLCGERGLTPISIIFKRSTFFDSPSIFWWHYSDRFAQVLAVLGVALSLFAITGLSEAHGLGFQCSRGFSCGCCTCHL